MLNKIRYGLQGTVVLLIVAVSTIILTSIIVVLAIGKRLAPQGVVRNAVTRWLSVLGEWWIAVNSFLARCYRGMRWDVHLPEGLDTRGRYLVLCNHQSWVDILVLQHCFNRKVPFMRFMLKQQLIWVPFLGIAWWALDMPFLRRYTRQQLIRNPALRGKDLENAARACEKLKHIPVSMMSFPEGTRFTPEKHAQQNPAYAHLLAPRYGGIGQVLYSFGDALRTAIDVTIVYPNGRPTLWQFVSGQVRRISICARLLEIDADLRGIDFRADRVAKRRLKLWLDRIWSEKDRVLASTRQNGRY